MKSEPSSQWARIYSSFFPHLTRHLTPAEKKDERLHDLLVPALEEINNHTAIPANSNLAEILDHYQTRDHIHLVDRHFKGKAHKGDDIPANLTQRFVNLTGSTIRKYNWTDADMQSWKLYRTAFKNCTFESAKFCDVNAISSLWKFSLFKACDFNSASLSGARFYNSVFQGGSAPDIHTFSKADMSKAFFLGCTFEYIHFPEAKGHGSLDHAMFGASTLRQSDLIKSTLKHSQWKKCKLIDCDMSHSNFEQAHFYDCDFSHENAARPFTGSKLKDVTFDHCGFEQTHFPQTRDGGTLEGTKWTISVIDKSNLTHTSLSHSQWMGCDIANTDLSGSDLRHARFTQVHFRNDAQAARFSGTDITGARFKDCEFTNIDFRDIKGAGLPTFTTCKFVNCILPKAIEQLLPHGKNTVREAYQMRVTKDIMDIEDPYIVTKAPPAVSTPALPKPSSQRSVDKSHPHIPQIVPRGKKPVEIRPIAPPKAGPADSRVESIVPKGKLPENVVSLDTRRGPIER